MIRLVAACRRLTGNLNQTHLALAKEVQDYRERSRILCSRLLRDQLVRGDAPHPRLTVNIANRWRDIFGESSASGPLQGESRAAYRARRARYRTAEELWLAVGYDGVGVVLRLTTPCARRDAIRLLLGCYRSNQPRRALSRNEVQAVLEPAGLFVDTTRRRRTDFLYQVGSELHWALQQEGASARILRHTSRGVSEFILLRCRPVRGNP